MTDKIFDVAGAIYAEDGTFMGLNFKTLQDVDLSSATPGAGLFKGLSDKKPLEYEAEFVPGFAMESMLPKSIKNMLCSSDDPDYNLCQDHTSVFLWYAPKEARAEACQFGKNSQVLSQRAYLSVDTNASSLKPYFNIDLALVAAKKNKNVKFSADKKSIKFDIPNNKYVKQSDEEDPDTEIGFDGDVYGNNYSGQTDSDGDGIADAAEEQIIKAEQEKDTSAEELSGTSDDEAADDGTVDDATQPILDDSIGTTPPTSEEESSPKYPEKDCRNICEDDRFKRCGLSCKEECVVERGGCFNICEVEDGECTDECSTKLNKCEVECNPDDIKCPSECLEKYSGCSSDCVEDDAKCIKHCFDDEDHCRDDCVDDDKPCKDTQKDYCEDTCEELWG